MLLTKAVLPSSFYLLIYLFFIAVMHSIWGLCPDLFVHSKLVDIWAVCSLGVWGRRQKFLSLSGISMPSAEWLPLATEQVMVWGVRSSFTGTYMFLPALLHLSHCHEAMGVWGCSCQQEGERRMEQSKLPETWPRPAHTNGSPRERTINAYCFIDANILSFVMHYWAIGNWYKLL